MLTGGPEWEERPFGASKTLAVVNDSGLIIGAVVYHNYDPWTRSIELSFASRHGHSWLTRAIICELLSYPFDQLSCVRITGCTPRKATSARRFLDKFGFKREGVVRRGFLDDDAIISGLLVHEWRRSKWAKALPQRLAERKATSDGQEEQDHRNPA